VFSTKRKGKINVTFKGWLNIPLKGGNPTKLGEVNQEGAKTGKITTQSTRPARLNNPPETDTDWTKGVDVNVLAGRGGGSHKKRGRTSLHRLMRKDHQNGGRRKSSVSGNKNQRRDQGVRQRKVKKP